MKKLLFSLILLSSIACASAPQQVDTSKDGVGEVIFPYICQEGKLFYPNQLITLSDFCVNGLMVDHLKDCRPEMDKLHANGTLESVANNFFQERQKYLCGK